MEAQLAKSNNCRDDKWTKSVAVGSADFVKTIKGLMGAAAIGRKAIESDGSFQVREAQISYGYVFKAEKIGIAVKNTCFWGDNFVNKELNDNHSTRAS